ncbi:MAG: hypothetical protein B6D46_15490 [Polyangiaceae bacterium UTPRO1]|jgi:soluble lytic murein transglycosylase|nr:transglycosylase SLT domain-containing protein [Myxococcales bacterium]OQY64860.1 MAG: hypothetical protein B6D46_15490 [Polyangiaceae bacterium UTPRO1]
MGVVGVRAVNMALLAALLIGGCAATTARPPSRAARAYEVGAVRATFLDAVARYERGALDEARPLFRSLLAVYPVLADYHLNYLAAIAERTRDLSEAAALDDRLLQTQAASVWAAAAAARRARTALALGDARTAELAERARDLAGDDADARGSALGVLASLRAETDPRGAYVLYQEVRSGGGNAAAAARDAGARLEAAHPELLREPDLMLAEGRVLTAEGRLDLATVRLRTAAAGAAGGERVVALEALARVEKQAGRIDDAIAAYRRAIDLTPSGGMARFELASLYWNRDRDADARALFSQIVAESPRHPKYDAARYALARIAEQEGRPEEADALLRALAADTGELAREARWRLAWAPYRRGDLEAAAKAFAALGAGDDKDRVAAAYWRGRIFARQGRAEESRQAFASVLVDAPESYYADLAERALGITAAAPPPAAPIDATPPAAVTTLHAYHWERSRELGAMGMNDAATREIGALVRELPDGDPGQSFALAAYSNVEAPGRALRLAQRLQSSLPASTLAAYQFPRAYWSSVVRAANDARLDPYVVLAVMRQESLFERTAVSVAAAYGLMQLLMPTASRVAGRPIDATALFDSTTNITLGARYLRQLLDRYDADLAKALAAYNGGEAAVAKWEQRAPGAASDEFVETISYRETRHYVKQVLANYRRYRRLYDAGGGNEPQDAGGSPSADTSFPASPPNPPFDISTTTSPDAA